MGRPDASVDSIVTTYILSHLEPAIAIVGACMVTYRRLFANLHLRLPSILSRSNTDSTSRRTGSTSNPFKVGSNGADTSAGLDKQPLHDHKHFDQGSLTDRPFAKSEPIHRHGSMATDEYEFAPLPTNQETSRWV